ncbi:MAG: hypothetical protein HFG91_05640 [Acholeplasmatales bacterium]|jgi:transposase-like protein|nr:hypothetical protein [Acholeplasmatales bacterium]
MKITKEQKLKMAREHIEEGIPLSELVKKYNYNISNVKYQCALYQRYGAEAFKKSGIKTYTREEKLEAIKRNKTGTSMRQIALDHSHWRYHL